MTDEGTVAEALAALHRRPVVAPLVQASRWFTIAVGPVRLRVPHPGQLHWHDVHHVALGAGHDLVGEAEVSAFELRTGPPTVLIAFLCVSAIALGLVVGPRRTWRAWRRARGCRNCYGADWAALSGGSVSALRAWMGLAPSEDATPATGL